MIRKALVALVGFGFLVSLGSAAQAFNFTNDFAAAEAAEILASK